MIINEVLWSAAMSIRKPVLFGRLSDKLKDGSWHIPKCQRYWRYIGELQVVGQERGRAVIDLRLNLYSASVHWSIRIYQLSVLLPDFAVYKASKLPVHHGSIA